MRMLEGIKFLELLHNVMAAYVSADMRNKRRILDFVTSNSVWKDGQIHPNYREPFATIALMGMGDETKQAVSGEVNGLRLVLRDFRASFRNLCYDPPVEMVLIMIELDEFQLLLLSV